jgi:hypothetical protein
MLLSLADFSFATKSTVVKPRESKASFILVKAILLLTSFSRIVLKSSPFYIRDNHNFWLNSLHL